MSHRIKILLAGLVGLAALGAAAAWQIHRWGQPVPLAYRLVAVTPSNPGTGRSWTYLREADGRRVFADDLDGDGTADQFYHEGDPQSFHRPTAEDPETRWLIVCLDGVPLAEMQALWREGYFREFFPPVGLLSPFPSDSETALTDVFHADPVPGYEHRYFDRSQNQLAGGVLSTWSEESIPYLGLLDYDQGGLFKGLTYVLPEKSYRADLGRLRKRFLASSKKVYLAHIASTDSLYHILPRERLRELLTEVDALLRELYLEAGGQLRILLFSDHGNSLIPSKSVPLSSHLEQNRWRLSGSLRGPRDVVVPAYGLVGFLAVYCQPERQAELAEVLVRLEGTDVVVYAEEANTVAVESRQGRARVSWDLPRARFRYEIETGDPLALQPILADLAAQNLLGEDGWAEDAVWFRATRDHVYPDPIYRLWQWANNHVRNPADLLVSLEPGSHYGSGRFEQMVSIRSTHGALDAAQSVGFAMSTDGPRSGPIRSRDLLFPTLNP